MTFGGWQEQVQTNFALDIYRELWPGCEIEENDSAGKHESMAKIFDFGGVDKIIRISGLQINMAQRFRKPFNGGQDPDFTLRYSRPYSSDEKTIEYERLMKAHENGAASYPRRYSFGRVHQDHSKGIYELFILDTDAFISAVKSGEITEQGPIPTHEGQEMMAYDIDEIRGTGVIVKKWPKGPDDGSTSIERPDDPEDITSWADD